MSVSPATSRKKSQRKPRPGRSARLVGFPNGRTDGRTIGRLRRRRKRPRHRRHESPTNRQKKKPQKVGFSFKMLTNDRERSGWWVVAIPSLLVTNDPRRSLSLAPRARTMFSVEPIDQSARTTTLRFACVVVVKEEKHRQSFMVVVCSSSYLPRIHRSGNPSSYVPYERHATC